METSDAEYGRLLHRSRLMDLAQDILIVVTLDGVIEDINEAASAMHGLSVNEIIGTNCTEFLHPSSAKRMLDAAAAMYETGVDTTDTMSLEAIRHDGETVHFEIRVSYSVGDQRFYVVERDVTAQVLQTSQLQTLTEELHTQALTDTLTGVPNRAAFDKRMAEVDKSDEDAWLAMIDLDRFKTINDTFGHVAGDAVLIAIADRVSQAARSDELFARIGGDEFAIIAPAASEQSFREHIARIESLASMPVDVGDGVQLTATCSTGAAQRQSGETSSSWLRRSDREMYAIKEASRARPPVSWPSRGARPTGASNGPADDGKVEARSSVPLAGS